MLKYHSKHITPVITIICISLLFTSITIKNNCYKSAEDKTNKAIIQSPKSNILDNESINSEGRMVTAPVTQGQPTSQVKPLPAADPNAAIVISRL